MTDRTRTQQRVVRVGLGRRHRGRRRPPTKAGSCRRQVAWSVASRSKGQLQQVARPRALVAERREHPGDPVELGPPAGGAASAALARRRGRLADRDAMGPGQPLHGIGQHLARQVVAPVRQADRHLLPERR